LKQQTKRVFILKRNSCLPCFR